MPELPEVEVIGRGWPPGWWDRVFSRSRWGTKRLRRGTSAEDLASGSPATALRLTRRGKYVLFLWTTVSPVIHGHDRSPPPGRARGPRPPCAPVFHPGRSHHPHLQEHAALRPGPEFFPTGRILVPLEPWAGNPCCPPVEPGGSQKCPGMRARPLKNCLMDGPSWPTSATSTPVRSCSPPASTRPRPPGRLSLEPGGRCWGDPTHPEAGHPAGRHYGEQLPEQPRRDPGFFRWNSWCTATGGTLPPLREEPSSAWSRPAAPPFSVRVASRKTFLIAIFLINR